jgi:uncharacterized membrane protein
MESIKVYIDYIASGVEVVGVFTIVIGSLIALFKYTFSLQKMKPRSYKFLRQELGKAILLGLEILVAGDIIGTVVTEPTMGRVLVLAVIVLIRTFLSLSLEVELEGRFPWQQSSVKSKSSDSF